MRFSVGALRVVLRDEERALTARGAGAQGEEPQDGPRVLRVATRGVVQLADVVQLVGAALAVRGALPVDELAAGDAVSFHAGVEHARRVQDGFRQDVRERCVLDCRVQRVRCEFQRDEWARCVAGRPKRCAAPWPACCPAAGAPRCIAGAPRCACGAPRCSGAFACWAIVVRSCSACCCS